MPCPFLTKLSASYVRNYGASLLEAYGKFCPVVSARSVETLASGDKLEAAADGELRFGYFSYC